LAVARIAPPSPHRAPMASQRSNERSLGGAKQRSDALRICAAQLTGMMPSVMPHLFRHPPGRKRRIALVRGTVDPGTSPG